MATKEMIMPSMGESIMEGTILSWFKKEGDNIEQDESVLEVATDKVDTEVPAPYGGVLKKILAKKGEVIGVGEPIAIIETGDHHEETTKGDEVKAARETVTLASIQEKILPPHFSEPLSPSPVNLDFSDERFYSPLVKNIARKEGISKMEMATIPGTGKDGRVTKQDMFHYLEGRSSRTPMADAEVQAEGEDEIVVMDRMRTMIAEHMLESQKTSAHVTSFMEADLTNLVLWRNRILEKYMEKEGEKLTFTPFFVQAVAKAIKDFPNINVSVDGNKIIKKKDINIGVAVALPSGNLIVPVIKNADQLNWVGLSKKINDLAASARSNNLAPD